MRTCSFAMLLVAVLGTGAATWAGEQSTAGRAVDLYPIVQDGKWGYMNKDGKEVIKPQYDCAWDFSEGLACVQVDLLRGYIDDNGQMVIKPQYFMARPFSEGLAAVCVDAEKWGGFFVFNFGSGKWVYIDKTGKVVVNPKEKITAVAGEMHEGEARVQFEAHGHLRHSLMDNKGAIRKFVNRPVGRFSEGLAAWPDNKGPYGFMDHAGKLVIPYQYQEAGDFSEGLAPVMKDGKWSFIGKDGKPAFAAQFDNARGFSEGLAAVAINQAPPATDPRKPPKPAYKWGCIDETGKMIIEQKYDFVAPCSEGIIRFVVAGKHGYMDKTGKVVIEPKFDVAWEFHNGLARVEIDGKQGYINSTGAFVWQPSK